jgi:hypothetical protein
MAVAVVESQIRKLEEKLKPFLYEGPFTSHLGLLEQKTKLRREQIVLGISLSLLFLSVACYLSRD